MHPDCRGLNGSETDTSQNRMRKRGRISKKAVFCLFLAMYRTALSCRQLICYTLRMAEICADKRRAG